MNPIRISKLVFEVTELFRLLKTGESFHTLIKAEDEYNTDKRKHVSNTMQRLRNWMPWKLKQFLVHVWIAFQIPTANIHWQIFSSF
jgi:hypothetical protein